MNDEDPKLRTWIVSLREEPGDTFQLKFQCQAEDGEHAAEQAEDAYPGSEVIHATPID